MKHIIIFFSLAGLVSYGFCQEKVTANNQDLELKIRETNNALLELNRKLAQLQTEMQNMSQEIKKSKLEDKKQSFDSELELSNLKNSITNTETEIQLLKKEIVHLQERLTLMRTDSYQSEEPKPKKIWSSPWIAVAALVLAIVSLVV